jgi:hypothetical protein
MSPHVSAHNKAIFNEYIILIASSTECNVEIFGFEVFTAVTKMKRVLWGLTLCSLVGSSDVLEELVMGRHIPEGLLFQY